MTHSDPVAAETGALFGDLWPALDARLYQESVDLFDKRCAANGFDPSFFKGKRCLDAGCGGGRNSIAMASHGANVTGIDLSARGIEDARTRVPPGLTVEFRQGSVLALPYDDATFDFVWCGGVLHHTADFHKGMDEITRVLKPGGSLFLLIYGTGGYHWESTDVCRPACARMGYEFADRAVQRAGLPANKRKSFLDCFFVPVVGYFTHLELELMLKARGCDRVDLWHKGKFDHEESPETLRERLVMQRSIFKAAMDLATEEKDEARAEWAALCENATRERIVRADFLIAERDRGHITAEQCYGVVVGQGNTRLIAHKAG